MKNLDISPKRKKIYYSWDRYSKPHQPNFSAHTGAEFSTLKPDQNGSVSPTPPNFESLYGRIVAFETPKKIEKKSFVQRVPVFKLTVIVGSIVVLLVSIFTANKFISFANSVSIGKQNITDNIGSTLGSVIPAFKQLDQSNVADAIRGNKTVNILLLGYGGGGHSGGYLTDSILLLSISFATNQSSLISIPRDLWVQMPLNAYQGPYYKINAAYELGLDNTHYPNKLPQFTGQNGAGNMAKYMASEVLGLRVDYFVAIDFSGFKQIVDTLGGVDINVDNAFTDYTYPNGDQNTGGPDCIAPDPNNSTCRYKKIHFDPGLQHMNGDRALEYVRSRHAAGVEGSDFARSRRQQKLIASVEKKALSLGMLSKTFELMDDVQGHFQTDLAIAEIKDLSGYLSNLNFDKANKASIDDDNLLISNYSSDGQWILEPSAGLNKWGDIHTYVYDILNDIKSTLPTPVVKPKTLPAAKLSEPSTPSQSLPVTVSNPSNDLKPQINSSPSPDPSVEHTDPSIVD